MLNALEKLKQFCSHHPQDILKISYNGLDDEKKCIFLDVACLFLDQLDKRAENVIAVMKGRYDLLYELNLYTMPVKKFILSVDLTSLVFHIKDPFFSEQLPVVTLGDYKEVKTPFVICYV